MDTARIRAAHLVDRAYIRISPSGCWLWERGKDTTGYGIITRGGKSYRAHRVVYEGLRGPIPDGMNLDHLCVVRACVNPAHLEAVTQHTNMRRCPQVTKLSLDQVREIRLRHAAGGISYAALGREFGVTDRNISFIARFLSWAKDL